MLQLTDPQRAELARILASQHEEIRKLWREKKVPPEYRVSAMRAINDKTEERIRELLNDEQKTKYIASHPRESSQPSQESTLDYWLHATQPK
jgi:phage shock protein A